MRLSCTTRFVPEGWLFSRPSRPCKMTGTRSTCKSRGRRAQRSVLRLAHPRPLIRPRPRPLIVRQLARMPAPAMPTTPAVRRTLPISTATSIRTGSDRVRQTCRNSRVWRPLKRRIQPTSCIKLADDRSSAKHRAMPGIEIRTSTKRNAWPCAKCPAGWPTSNRPRLSARGAVRAGRRTPFGPHEGAALPR